MVNPIGLNAPQKNRLTVRQMNKLKKLIGNLVVATDFKTYASCSDYFDGSVAHAEQDALKAGLALNIYLDSLMEKK